MARVMQSPGKMQAIVNLPPPIARSDVAFSTMKETEIMMNGLKIGEDGNEAEVVDFEAGVAAADAAPAVGAPQSRTETLAERRRREHEEYKKKRDSDPAFIPNRGAFFMHDSRSAPGQNAFRPIGGRGRGRGAIGGPFSPAKYVPQRQRSTAQGGPADTGRSMRQHAPEATDSPWQHDLHDQVNAPHQQQQQHHHQQQPAQHSAPTHMHAPHAPSSSQHQHHHQHHH